MVGVFFLQGGDGSLARAAPPRFSPEPGGPFPTDLQLIGKTQMSTLKSTAAVALAMGLGMGIAAMGAATAADQPRGQSSSETIGTPRPAQTSSSIPGGIPSDEIIGRKVVNQRGETLGKIEELVVQPQKKEVHAVISVGGFLGIGDHDVVVPMKDLSVTPDNVTLISQQTKEDLKTLPKYDENKWQDLPRAKHVPDGSSGNTNIPTATPPTVGTGTNRP